MSSRSRVTITLGRSGQVVKRGLSEGDFSDNGEPSVGIKRSVRDRLGNQRDSLSQNKRQRKGRNEDMDDDMQLESNHRMGRDDLRFKLMHKNSAKKANVDVDRRDDIDLRERLSRSNRAPVRFSSRDNYPEPAPSSSSRRIPPTRSADDLLRMESQRRPHSGWSNDKLRHRSPDSLLGTSRAYSPPAKRIDDMRHASSVRSTDPPRHVPYMRNSVIESSRPSPYMTKSSVPIEPQKPVVRLPPPTGPLPKSSFVAEEPHTVGTLLGSLGLSKYAIIFQAEEVDLTALKQMSDHDLKELGIPMGPRKKILLALAPRSKPRHA